MQAQEFSITIITVNRMTAPETPTVWVNVRTRIRWRARKTKETSTFLAITEHAMHFDSDAYNNEKLTHNGGENDPGEVKEDNKAGDPLRSLTDSKGGGKNSDR